MNAAAADPVTTPRLAAWWLLPVISAGLLLAFVEPAGQWFYPRCLWHSMSGTTCPGCGGLRATHALLHGDFVAAWALNPLLLLLGPWLAYEAAIRLPSRRTLPSLLIHRWVQVLVIAAILAFTVWRNRSAS
ncbi:MAG TPA: DUF2752 domain-containing protein [Roseimicrobium sp.]|nr:DUF2752 domain-containing protein [Roseimicrobium sp.]